MSESAQEIMQRVASGLNRSKRQSNLILQWLAGITEIVLQVTTYNKIFSSGYRHLILGRTTTSPANYATVALQRGSFR
jgi:hypothetical protein